MYKNFKQLDQIRAFQRFVLGYYPTIREMGVDQQHLEGSYGNYKSKIFARIQLPKWPIESLVMLLDEWPVAEGAALGDALDAFSKLEYDSVFRANSPLTNRPVAAWGRRHATCDPDHHSVIQFELWGEPDKRLAMFYQARTTDLIGSFASDYLTAVVIQTLLAAVFWRDPGTLLFQGTVHYHAEQEELLQRLEPVDVEVDFLRLTRWNELVLPRWTGLLDQYHARAAEIPRAQDRFQLLQILAKAGAGELRKGSLV
jgi:hypothetical protein